MATDKFYVMFYSYCEAIGTQFFTVNSIGHDYPSCCGVTSDSTTLENFILFAPFWGKFSTL